MDKISKLIFKLSVSVLFLSLSYFICSIGYAVYNPEDYMPKEIASCPEVSIEYLYGND
jgi:hypothetical protein